MTDRYQGTVPGAEQLIEQLQSISEELGDMALLRLHRAVGTVRTASGDRRGDTGDGWSVSESEGALGDDAGAAAAILAAEERRLTRARRAVERALAVLGGSPDDDDAW